MENHKYRRDLENALITIKQGMKPQVAIDETRIDNYSYQFEGALRNGVTFAGEHNLPNESRLENAFIYLSDKDQELGVLVTDNGFVAKAPSAFLCGRDFGGGDYVKKNTALSFYSPNWNVTDGMAYKVSEVDDQNGQAINQVNIYHAPYEAADEVLKQLCCALYGEREQADEQAADATKLSHLNIGGQLKDNAREM